MQSLLESIDAHTTVLTVNQRLAREIRLAMASRAAARGVAVWRTPDVMPVGAWVERGWNDYLDTGDDPPVVLLTGAQERALWEACVQSHTDDSIGPGLLQADGAARLAQTAFGLIKGWRVGFDERSGGDDARAFLGWSAAFERRCAEEGWLSRASALDAVAALAAAGKLALPRRLVLAGFDRSSPQLEALVRSLEGRGVELIRWVGPDRAAIAHRTELFSPEDEVEAAARWARARLEAGASGPVGVVFLELETIRGLVQQGFEAWLGPGAASFDERGTRAAFELSGGPALATVPVVRAGLLGLGLGRGRIEIAALDQLLHSPFLAGSSAEEGPRALLGAHLRRQREPEVSTAVLVRTARRARYATPVLAERAGRLLELASGCPHAQPAAGWSREFSTWLRALGWPGEGRLDREEAQAVEGFENLLTDLAALGLVHDSMSLSQALSVLDRLAAEQPFRPRRPPAPVQVLDATDSTGLEFSQLWVAGLHDGVWPRSARPNPFIPGQWQRRLDMPHATPAWELEFSRAMTARWLRAADEVVLSHAAQAGDQALRPSPLLAPIQPMAPAALARCEVVTYRERISASAPRLEVCTDYRAPRLRRVDLARGGATLFKDQAACPFRAFAIHRLAASGLDPSASGLDARDRGSLVHEALANFWHGVAGHAELVELGPEALAERVRSAVGAALAKWSRRRPATLRGRFAELERERIEALLARWLEREAARRPFVVDASEQDTAMRVGGLPVQVRPDRIDRLEDGRLFLIDYKTGEANLTGWLGARPEEPQLPLYCTALDAGEGCVAGVAFGFVRADQVEFSGLADEASIAPGLLTPERWRTRGKEGAIDWDSLKSRWRGTLDALAAGFVEGDARVDPKAPGTCRNCEVEPFCRIKELRGLAGEDEPA